MKMKIARLLCLFLLPSVAGAAVLKKAEVTAVINEVKLLDPSAGERGARVADVVEGEIGVKTGIKSRAELLFQDKTLTRLGANTLFSFNEGTRNLELEHGTMLLQCPKGVGGAKIRTAAVTAAITGTTILLEYSPAPTPKRPPGYIPTIAEMTPDEALAELQHPRRNYSQAERSALEAKAKKRKKGGSGGYVKVLVLEGTLRLFLNTRMGESVLVSAGQMIILDPKADVIPPPVQFDIAHLAQTSLLVDNKVWGNVATDLSLALVAKEETAQSKQIARGQLLATNLVIPGSGTEVFSVAQLNEINQAPPIAFLNPVSSPTGNPPTAPPTQTVPVTGNPPPPANGQPILTAITSSNPYIVDSGTVISTDPSITRGGVKDYGLIGNSGGGQDLAVFAFGSRSPFDANIISPPNQDTPITGGIAGFKFLNLQLTGVPSVVTTGGTQYLGLIADGTITTGNPGGVFNLDVLHTLFLGTVDGTITMGPQFSFTSTAVYVPIRGNDDHPVDFVLYARGATSDLLFGSNVNFGDRQLGLNAEHNVVVSSQISAISSTDPLTRYDSDVGITAGNDFILSPTGQITASQINIQAQDVVGSSGLVNTVNLQVTLQNAVTLTQSGGLLYVNTLPISQTNLQNIDVSGNAGLTVSGNVTTSTAPNPTGSNTPTIGLILNSAAGDIVINGNLTTNHELEIQTDHNFIVNPGGSVTAQNVDIDTITGGITLPGNITLTTATTSNTNGNPFGVYFNSDNGDVTNTGNVTINGHFTTNNYLQINATGNLILGPSGRITAPNISIQTQDVAGSGGAVIDGASAVINIQIQNAATLTQSGNLFYLNTLPIDETTALQNLFITSTAGINIPSNVNVNTATSNYSTFQLQSNGALNINGHLTATNDVNIQVSNLVVGASALVQAPNVNVVVTSTNAATVTVSGNNLVFNSLPIDISAIGSYTSVSAPTINVAPNLTLPGSGGVNIGETYPVFNSTGTLTGWLTDTVHVAGDITSNTGLNFSGKTTVTGNVNAAGLGIGLLTVGGSVNANESFWTGSFSNWGSPYSNNNPNGPTTGAVTASPSSLTASSVNSPSGINFAGASEGSNMGGGNTAYLPDNGHVLTLNAPTVIFDTSNASPYIGPAVFDGGDALAGNNNQGGNGGTLNVNATSDITVNTTISATTGANANGVSSGGTGGTVNLTTTGGAVTVNSSIQVSSDGLTAPTNRVSRQGGNITLQTGKTTGSGITVTNSGQLLALLNATAPGPGGTVKLISAGAGINVSGKIQADRGTINVQNNGSAGQVAINSTAQLAADVIKVGALGTNGQVTVQAGSQLNAVNTLELYGGTGALGEVLFTGAGTVNLSGGTIHIAATTVQIDSSTHVNNSGSTFVHATNNNYGVGAGGGNFQNSVTKTPLSGAPSY
jgi:hypothetical protein